MAVSEKTIDRFSGDLSMILQDNLHEIIIHGSYVLGDFFENSGDLDFMVLTNQDINRGSIRNLTALHEEYRRGKQFLLHQLEGTYCPKSFMADPEAPFQGLYIGTTSISPMHSRRNSFMDLRVISQHGLMLLNSGCRVYDPDENQLLAEQKSCLESYRESLPAAESPETGLWISLVHWCARTLYYGKTGLVSSKTEACRWCIEQPSLAGFRSLFGVAETARHPYNIKAIIVDVRRSCLHLLDMVDTELGKAKGR